MWFCDYLPPRQMFTEFTGNVRDLWAYYKPCQAAPGNEELKARVNNAARSALAALLITGAVLAGACILYSTMTLGLALAITAVVSAYVMGHDLFAMSKKRAELDVPQTAPAGLLNAIGGLWYDNLNEQQINEMLDVTIARFFWSCFFKTSTLSSEEKTV